MTLSDHEHKRSKDNFRLRTTKDVEMDSMCSIEQNERLLKHTVSDNFSSSDMTINEVCSIGPNEELLKAVDSNNLALFKTILRCKPVKLNYVYSSNRPYTGTIIEVCCRQTDKWKFVRELLLFGVAVNYLEANQKKAPIHLAAMNSCKDVLNVLLEEPKTDINILDDDGNSALHLATIAGSVECVSLLLNSTKDIKPNQLNRRGETPAYIAAISEQKNNRMMAAFIKCPKIYLNMTVLGKPLREVIEDNYPHITPFKYLYSRDTEGFVWHVNSTRELDGYDGEYTYLQYACTFCLPKAVQALLDLNADPNERIGADDMCPVFTAAHNGFADVVRVFLNSNKPVIYQMNEGNTRKINDVVPHYTSALHVVISGWAFNRSSENDEFCDYKRTYDILLPVCADLDIDYADSLGNTCLHIAAFVRNRHCVFTLLDLGAYVGKKNGRGKPPLAYFCHHVLRSYLNQCVITNDTFKNDIEPVIKCSYTFLCPPRVYEQKDTENQMVTLADIPETYPLLYMSEMSELRSLLLHPVLTTFICLKWSKIKRFYFMYLIFYSGFLASLTLYIIMCPFEVPLQNIECKIDIYLWLTAFYVGFIICELFQCILCPLNHIMTLENCLKISIIISTAGLLSEHFTKEIRIPLSIVAIQLSWGEFIIILGRHPKFSVPLLTLKVVSKNFLKILVWYSISLSAFALSFYVLFKNENTMLRDFSLMSFTTAIMSTGEFSSNQLPFFPNQIIGRLLFILSVFCIPMVLVNILSSLTVSDTRKIQKDAEIVALVSRVKFIHSFETILVSNVFSYMKYSSVGRDVFSLLTLWLGIDLMIFPNDLKNSERMIFPCKKIL